MFHEYVFNSFVYVFPAIVICFILLAMGCVCGCRRKVPKNELLGLAGMVKLRNPDDQISLNQQMIHSPDQFNSSSRANGGGATRSLPDLPVDQKLWALPSGDTADTNSDLYATVEDAGRRNKSGNAPTIEPEVEPEPSAEDNYTTDDSLSRYARLNSTIEHPYAQLDEPVEHRYARVGEAGSTGGGRNGSTPGSASPPSRRSNEGNGSPGVERIAAASAIAGTVPANHDLPYMTPPIAPVPQAHFSGDSQDSAKGYTSISVREPLSRILVKDPHYSTVSDVDSDDMYAAIEDRGGARAGAANNDYSGSETYARIGPQSNLSHIMSTHYQEASGSETYARIGGRQGESEPMTPGDYATSGSETYAQIGPRQDPQPSECLIDAETYAQVAPTHARQESWSSVSPGSPRKEKREANSPLPEPPSSPIDAMYAKVMKKQRSVTDTTPAIPSPSPQVNGDLCDPKYETVDQVMSAPGSHYETVGCSGLSVAHNDPPYEKLNKPTDIYAQINKHQAEKNNEE